jgi:hypothetical protein
MSLAKDVAWLAALIIGVYIAVNATFMLVSPSTWFRLPLWIRANGTMSEKKFGSGWRALELRLTGALMLGLIAWVIYDGFLRHRQETDLLSP